MQASPIVVGQQGLIKDQQMNSVTQTLNNNIDFSYPLSLDANGWPDTFSPANLNCTLIRVGATGTTPKSQVVWTATDTQIPHNLGTQPIGFIVVYKDKTCDVFASSTTKNDSQFIYLTITDDTANTTLLIF